ncbi:MAG: PaaI family thioesterase [Spirochaetae bacterium HGW-Spirochaetae-5]|nr:MAG: PaaI family thioesterase [Spirochaetae bacterium HGW-Spirochaetae-5]
MVTMDVFEKHYLDLVKFDRFLGMKLKVHAPGKITYTLEIIDNHLSTPDQCHGGVISAMMDSVLGVTALSLAVSNGNLCSTVEYKINYLSTAKPGDILEGNADIDLSGSTLIYTSGTIKEIKTGRVIAKGMGTFLQYPISKKMVTLKSAGLGQ